MRIERPRVLVGYDWEKGSITDHFRENLSRFKLLLIRKGTDKIPHVVGGPRLTFDNYDWMPISLLSELYIAVPELVFFC